MRVVKFDLGKHYLTLSSALYPEGISYVNNIVLILVSKDYCNKNPWSDIERYKERGSLVFMTAAKNFIFETYDNIKLFISAGIGESGEDAGCTINIGVFVDYPLNLNGLIDLVRTLTEAKCGALRDLNLPFTGTVSDAIAVGSIIGENYFAGPGTEMGKKIAKIVREKIKKLLS
ncbi:adenosylcobinamide amidohydrolase [Sulfurisphaera javensis]|uniref:Adenosylcobinamide amidohydrolase n=1 Tax=Sulfurisphaera javensis TaxID=2049879 RepID=A0AAT9GQZ9_9CREN